MGPGLMEILKVVLFWGFVVASALAVVNVVRVEMGRKK